MNKVSTTNFKRKHADYVKLISLKRYQEVKELGQRRANESGLSDEDKVRVSQLLDIAKARKSLAESKRVYRT